MGYINFRAAASSVRANYGGVLGYPPYSHMPLYRHLAAYATALSNNITILHWLSMSLRFIGLLVYAS